MPARPYQRDIITDTRQALREGITRPLIVLPTGGGKGFIASQIVQGAANKQKRIVFLVNRKALVHDMSKRLFALGVNHGVLMGSASRQQHLPVVVASVDTLRNRLDSIRQFDLAFADEAHYAITPTWTRILEAFGSIPVIGMTATPIRADQKGLGRFFERIISGPSVQELTEQNYLVPTRIYAPDAPDLSGVTTQMGDYNKKQLADAMDKPTLTGSIVQHWRELGEGRPTILFATCLKHSERIRDQFSDAGISAECIDGDMSIPEREAVWSRVRSGETKIACTVMTCSYGFDEPMISCAILARPTQSLALHLQQCGRILRPFEGKRDAIILDHAGNVSRDYRGVSFGFPDEPREWSLEDGIRRTAERGTAKSTLLPRTCPDCLKVMRPTAVSCDCGYVFSVSKTSAGMMPEEIDGRLKEVTRPTYPRESYGSSDDPAIARLIEKAHSRGYKPAYIWVQRKRLMEARQEYRAAMNSEPQPHWTPETIKAIVSRNMQKSA